jgi:hypothetical protein
MTQLAKDAGGPDLATLRAALRVVQRDLDTEEPGPGRLRLVGTETGVFVALPDGRFWPGGAGALPSAPNLPEAVAAVAEATQECLGEILWKVWPLCPDHGTGMYVRATESAGPAWACGLEGGHTAAAVGELRRAAARVRPPGADGADDPEAAADTPITREPLPVDGDESVPA